RIGSLSKGERKRLLLAMGLLTLQPLLMLDEPFDGLDLRQTRDVMALLRSQAERGRTLMLSIHQLVDAARVCDRLILLSHGRVVGEGTIDELRAQANLSDGGPPEAGLEEIFLALTLAGPASLLQRMARIDGLARLLAIASGRRPARRPRLYQRRRSLRRGERRWRRACRFAARIDSARRDARAYFWRLRSGRDSAFSVRGDPFDRGGKRERRVET